MFTIFTPKQEIFAALDAQLNGSCRHVESVESLSGLLLKMSHDTTNIFILVPENNDQLQSIINLHFISPVLLLLPIGFAGSVNGCDISGCEYMCHFLQRPFRLHELKQAVSNLQSLGVPITIGTVTMNNITLQLSGAGGQCYLTTKEAELLRFLHKQKQAVSKEKLLQEIWGYNADIDTHTMETTLYRLRGKLEKISGEALQICNNENGYYLKIKP